MVIYLLSTTITWPLWNNLSRQYTAKPNTSWSRFIYSRASIPSDCEWDTEKEFSVCNPIGENGRAGERMLSADGSDAFGTDATGSTHHPHRVRSHRRLLPWWPRSHPIQRRMCFILLLSCCSFIGFVVNYARNAVKVRFIAWFSTASDSNLVYAWFAYASELH